jgi:microcystin-dependent protein
MQLPAPVVADPLAQKNFEALQALVFSPGDLKPTMAATAPVGWVLADGATYNSVDYPALAAAMGATGATFTVPDLRGRVPVGAGTGAGLTARTLAATGGTEPANMPTHTHTVTAAYADTSQAVNAAGTTWGSLSGGTTVKTSSGPTPAASGADNMPPFLVVNWMIRT